MTESTIRPQAIEIDTVKNGVADIRVHWDIVETEREDEMSEKTQTMYTYEEARIKNWVLPLPMTTRTEVEAYFASNETEILGYAQGAHVQMISDEIYQCKTRKQAVALKKEADIKKEAADVVVVEKSR